MPNASKKRRYISPKDALITSCKNQEIKVSYKKVCKKIINVVENHSSKVLICSGIRNYEDHSYINSANIAMTLAETGGKTLLIDGNLRNPSLHRIFGCINGLGLSGMPEKLIHWRECIRENISANLDLFVAGTFSKNPGKVLKSDEIKLLLETLSKEYDYIVLHTPPINVFSDAVCLAKQSIGVLLMVERQRTKHKALVKAMAKIKSADGEVLGVMITGYIPRKKQKIKDE